MAQIWFADEHEYYPDDAPPTAQTLAQLIMPRERQRVLDLCTVRGLDVQVETVALFGPGVNFYELTQQSALALIAALERKVEQVAA